jgi:hypothetical protein
VRIAYPAYVFFFLLSGACREGPTGPDPTLVVVEGSTASYQDLDVRLERFNLSWYPTDDSPFPSDGDVFATLLIEVTNRSDDPWPIRVDQFALRTLSFDLGLHAGPTWTLYDGGRTPRVQGMVVPPGESLAGWLTFELPRGPIAEEVLWSPAPDVVFGIEVRWFSAGRIEEARIFGSLRDENGSPLPGVFLTITPLETVPGIPGSEMTVGECTGTLHTVHEVVTDEAGQYQVNLHSVHGDELCIDVNPVADPMYRASGFVRLGRPSDVAEVPELRLDLTIGE